MEHTWASGAVELIKHADSHITQETAFDGRIAFISIDNAVETCIRVFLSLPSSKSGITVTRKELADIENNFPGLLALLWNRAGNRLTGLDDADIEHYHRIRNKLYHDGTGLSVDQQYLLACRQIAVLLLKHLFGVSLGEPRQAATLETLVSLWNQIEEKLKTMSLKADIEPGHTFFWEEAMAAGVISASDLDSLTELRLIRNGEVHSTSVDRSRISYAVCLAETLLKNLNASEASRTEENGYKDF